jgi:hypothetical protein
MIGCVVLMQMALGIRGVGAQSVNKTKVIKVRKP